MVNIDLIDVIKIYEEPRTGVQIPAIRNIELHVGSGEMVSIVGPSGSGKSTLLRLIGGLEKPSSGEINVGNIKVHELTEDELVHYRRYSVGFLWQFPERNLLPVLTARQNVELPMKLAGVPKSQRKRRAIELLSAVGVGQRMEHSLSKLSGGEAQRVGLAVALANDPDFILADEPTGELDTQSTMEVIDFLRQMNKDTGKTMIIVTHDKRFEEKTDRAYKIMDGQLSAVRRHALMQEEKRKEGDLIFVDQYGNMRLPKAILRKVGIKQFVSLEIGEDHLILRPVKEKKSSDEQ